MRAFLGVVMAACLVTGVFGPPVQAEPRSACEPGQVSQEGTCGDQDAVVLGQEAEAAAFGFPNPVCRPGYFQQGPRLCMTGIRGPLSFANAELDCRDILGRVADYIDWRVRILRGDGVPAPVGFWLGPLTGDNQALFVNQANIADFDGETSRFDLRQYVCAHDDDF